MKKYIINLFCSAVYSLRQFKFYFSGVLSYLICIFNYFDKSIYIITEDFYMLSKSCVNVHMFLLDCYRRLLSGRLQKYREN